MTCCLAVTGSDSWSIFSRPESYYDVLGVDVSVRGRELKAAYRRLSLEWHPDKHRGVDNKALAEAKITRINTAYKVLSDDVLRARYDWLLGKGEPEYVGTEEDWKLFDKDPALFEAYHFRDPNTRWGKEPEVSNLSILMAVVSSKCAGCGKGVKAGEACVAHCVVCGSVYDGGDALCDCVSTQE